MYKLQNNATKNQYLKIKFTEKDLNVVVCKNK